MDTRRLATFVRIVDVGSLTRAADVLHVAQPALSQQVNALEGELGQRLLIRSKQGVRPTSAGRVLYRHAQVILKQTETALAEVKACPEGVSGHVSLGLAPYSAAGLIALPLLQELQRVHPGITLRITDHFGAVMSEEMMNGRLDLALLFDPGPLRGVRFQRLFSEELVACSAHRAGESSVGWQSLAGECLLLPGPTHTIRRAVDEQFSGTGASPVVAAELESVDLLRQALVAGMGTAIVPRSVALRLLDDHKMVVRSIVPSVQVHLALGTPATLAMSEAAQHVCDVLKGLVDTFWTTLPAHH